VLMYTSNFHTYTYTIIVFISTDIDECAGAQLPCPEDSICLNTEGSYHCERCDEGFQANHTTNTCEGISLDWQCYHHHHKHM